MHADAAACAAHVERYKVYRAALAAWTDGSKHCKRPKRVKQAEAKDYNNVTRHTNGVPSNNWRRFGHDYAVRAPSDDLHRQPNRL